MIQTKINQDEDFKEMEKEKSLEDKISRCLDTHDKRYMFLKIFFPRLVTRINLEGSSYQVSFWIVDEFKKQSLFKELQEAIDKTFPSAL